MSNLYDEDVIAWAEQQSRLLRSRQWSQLDIDNIAEEIEDVGKSEKRELQSRMCVLMAHLLKWAYQPGRRGHSWDSTIREQRAAISRDIAKHPSHTALLSDAEWLAAAFFRARMITFAETGHPALPDQLPWTLAQLLSADFWPDAP